MSGVTQGMEKAEAQVLLERTEGFVRELIELSGLDLDVDSEIEGRLIAIELSGEDESLLLADNARLLYAINHLVNQVFYRQAGREYSFLVDCGNYRNERVAELELLAEKAAEKVRVSGSKVILQPMPSGERRIIHLALADEPDVRTESEGSGRYRRVQIVPA